MFPGRSWDIPGMCLGSSWDVSWTPLERSWNAKNHLSKAHEKGVALLECLVICFGAFLGCSWDVPGTFLRCCWGVLVI